MNAAFVPGDKVKIVAIICGTILLILGVLFYWYEYRLSKIREDCAKIAKKRAIAVMQHRAERGYEYYEYKGKEGWYVISDYENAYQECLREHGIEK